MKRTASIIAAGALMVVGASAGATPASAGTDASNGGSAQPGYNAIPAHVSANVPSVGFEATSTTSFGDEVTLSSADKTLKSMSVLFSSWGCQSGGWVNKDCVSTPKATFDVPLTFNVYADNGGTLGDLLATTTQTVAIAYRPSASVQCTGVNAGKWYDKADKSCNNGFPQTVELSFTDKVALPADVIWTVTYNTSHYGTDPLGQNTACYVTSGGCGYDSLNIGVNSFAGAPFSGTDVNEDQVFINGAVDSGWTGYRPLGGIATS